MVHYELNCDQYVMVRDGVPVKGPMDAIAIAYSIDSVDKLITLHKHGHPASVSRWLHEAKDRLATQGDFGRGMGAELDMIQGRLDVRLVNRALEGVQSALIDLVRNAHAIEVDGSPATAAQGNPSPSPSSVRRERDLAADNVTDVEPKSFTGLPRSGAAGYRP